MKRFIETNRWRDPWFRRLTVTAKHLWQWLLDHCDNAGVIDLDIEAASFDIGQPVDEKHLGEISSRLKTLPNGKLWIAKFVAFQYGELSNACRPHVQVIRLLDSHGLDYTLLEGYAKGIDTLQDKDKDKDKDKEGGMGETKTPATRFQKPSLDGLKLHAVEIGLSDLEAEKFWNYYESNGWRVGKNPMKCLAGALSNWKLRASEHSNGAQKSNGATTVIEGKELERIIERMKTIRSTYGDHQTWADEDKAEFIKLRTRKAELKTKLGIVA